MKNSVFLMVLASMWLCGCGEKKAYVHDPLGSELLAYTAKFEDTNIRFLALGTYLNPVRQGEANISAQNEHFVISILPKDAEIDPRSFTLNGDSNGTKVEIIDENDELMALTSFKAPWGLYLHVSAPTKEADVLSLEFNRTAVKISAKNDQNASAKGEGWDEEEARALLARLGAGEDASNSNLNAPKRANNSNLNADANASETSLSLPVRLNFRKNAKSLYWNAK